MTRKVDLRADLAIGRHALDPGRVCLVAEWMGDRPRSLPGLIELLWDEDAGVASRAADVLERVTRQPSPAMCGAVDRYKTELIGLLPEAAFPKLRWNLALILPRLTLTVRECRRVSSVLHSWLDDRSSIVKTAALHGMAELTCQDPESQPEIVDVLRLKGRSGTPAMRARSRILLERIEKGRGIPRARSGLRMYR